MTADQQTHDDFDARCQAIRQQWQSGDLSFKDAVATLDGYAREAATHNQPHNEGMAHLMLGILQHYRGNLNRSIQHYERARTLFASVDDKLLVTRVDLNLGENYRYKGDFNHALNLYRAAFNMAKEINHIQMQTIAAVNEGLTLSASQRFSSAHRAFQTALDLSSQWTEELELIDSVLCEVYYGLSKTFTEQGDLDAAWDMALESWKIAERNPQPMHIGFAYRTIGRVIAHRGGSPHPDFSSEPDEYFQAAIDAFKGINAEVEVARTKFAQALAWSAKGHRLPAARLLQQVMVSFTRLGMVGDAARAAEAQGKLL